MSSDPPADPVVLLAASDAAAWETLRTAAEQLDQFGLPWERSSSNTAAVGAYPDEKGWKAITVASADGELPAQWSRAAKVLTIRVPVEGKGLTGAALLCDASGQLPAGPDDGVFATMAIGTAGAKNAALFVVATLALENEALHEKWTAFRLRQTAAVLAEPAPSEN